MVKMMTWKKLNRSFSGCFGWHRIRQRSPRKHLAQNVATLETAVVTKSKFVDVVLQIFPAHRMVCAVNGAFELRPKAFNGVGMRAANNIFTSRVINSDVLESKLGSEIVDRRFIADDLRG